MVAQDLSRPSLISVIVRSMDRPSLGQALASIAAQEAGSVEVVLVNALGETHRQPPTSAGSHAIRWTQTGRPLPRSIAANVGLDAAQGARIIFLDDDDIFLPGHLARLASALDGSPDAVAAYADVEFGSETEDGWVSEHVFAAEFDTTRLRFENYLPLHAVMVDRSRGDARHCRFDESLELFEDWDWWLQLMRQGRFVHVPGVSARYRRSVTGDAGGTDGSGVFDQGIRTAQVREHLLLKWLQRDTPQERLGLLLALQTEYRSARHADAQLGVAQQTGQELHARLAHRERELADAGAQLDDVRRVLAARERELADAMAQIDSLRTIVAAREREIGDFHELVGELRRILSARDEEIANLRAALTPPQQS